MGYVPDAVVERLGSSNQVGIFLLVNTDPALHLYFGANDIPANFDGIDPDGTVYLGGGRLNGIPTLEVLVNGTADSVQFTLSGVDPATGTKVLDSIPEVRGADIMLGLTTLDDYYQPMTSPVPIWSGMASHVSEASGVVMVGEKPSLDLALSAVAGEATRSRAARVLWSSAHQKALSPTDKFCDETSRLSRGVNPTWGLGY
jgi:hypothetical protein